MRYWFKSTKTLKATVETSNETHSRAGQSLLQRVEKKMDMREKGGVIMIEFTGGDYAIVYGREGRCGRNDGVIRGRSEYRRISESSSRK